MKNITQALKVITLALIFSFGISYVYAWVAPSTTPPGGNASAPINVSTAAQYKGGAFGVGGLLRGYSDAIFDGNVGVGTSTPTTKLEVNGTIKSTGLQVTAGAGASKVLTSDATGNATWQTALSGTSLSSGSGIILSPNPITTTGTISADTAVVQARVIGLCTVGQAITAVSADGTVTCASAGSIIGGLIPKTSIAAVFGNKRTEVVSIALQPTSNCSTADTTPISGYCQMSADGLSSNFVMTSTGNGLVGKSCGQINTRSVVVSMGEGSCTVKTGVAFWQ